MARQPTDLADARLPLLIAACESGMKALLQTERAEVFFYAANGHGGWEAVIANLVAPGAAVLVPGTGHFSDGWAEQVEAFGGVALRTPYRRRPADRSGGRRGGAARRRRASHRRRLRRPHRHRERHDQRPGRDPPRDRRGGASGALRRRRRRLARRGAVRDGRARRERRDRRVAEGPDGPPGLAFVAADARDGGVARANPTPRYYWDWERRKSDHSYRKFCGTPPLAHMAGLEAALGLIAAEGLANVQARHARLARAVHAAASAGAKAARCASSPRCRRRARSR